MTAPHDVEDLLRRTYQAVADRTTVVDRSRLPDDVRLRPAAAPPRRSPQIAAVAAVAVLLIGGLVLLARRDTSAPANDSGLVHALAGWVPQVSLDQGGAAVFPVVGIVSTDDFDRLTWATDDGVVSIAVDRTGATNRPAGDTVLVRGGTTATRVATTDGGALTWLERPGIAVSVEWSGDVADRLVEDVIAGIFFVDRSTWERTVATGGFASEPRPALLQRRIDPGRPVEVELRGTIHDGFGVEIGNGGFSLPIVGCTASIDFSRSVDDGSSTDYVVLGSGSATAAEVSVDGEVVDTIELVPVFPGVDLTLGTIEMDRSVSADLPTAECAEAQR